MLCKWEIEKEFIQIACGGDGVKKKYKREEKNASAPKYTGIKVHKKGQSRKTRSSAYICSHAFRSLRVYSLT